MKCFANCNPFTVYCLLLTVCCLLVSCGGSLSDEQRKKIQAEMETSKIKKVSEAEITEAAFTKGRELITLLKPSTKDSVATANGTTIFWLEPGTGSEREIENQLIEAYLTNVSGNAADNVQRVGTDSLLYTYPVIEKQPDGVEVVKGMWSIYLSKKQLILQMPEK